jgi:hypothetical protein
MIEYASIVHDTMTCPTPSVQMLVEQKKLRRQSQLLVQSAAPGHALQEALREVAKLTQEVETQRLEHLQQV